MLVVDEDPVLGIDFSFHEDKPVLWVVTNLTILVRKDNESSIECKFHRGGYYTISQGKKNEKMIYDADGQNISEMDARLLVDAYNAEI